MKKKDKADINIISKVGGYLLKNKEGMFKHYSELNKKFDDIFEANHELIGRVLKCHLILEKYMNDCFLYYYGTDSKFENANLRFYQKLTLLEGKKILRILF